MPLAFKPTIAFCKSKNLKSSNKFSKKEIIKFREKYLAKNLSLSYKDPINTWNTNVLGTIKLLESLKCLKKKLIHRILI